MSSLQKWYRREYLHSLHWREQRHRLRELWGDYCCIERCKRRWRDPHHLSYEFVSIHPEKELRDLRPVCRLHHFFAHYRILRLRKIPLNRTQLTKRFQQIQRFTLRTIKPSDILKL